MTSKRNTWRQRIQQLGMWLVSREALTFVCCLAIAAALWVGHALASVRDLTLNVPLEYTHVPTDIVFEPKLPDHVSITLRDAGRRLLGERHNLPTITLDLASQIKGNSGTIYISAKQISQQLPDTWNGSGTAKIRAIKPETIESHYTERQTEKVFTLPIRTEGVPRGSRLRLFPPTITLTVNVPMSKYSTVVEKDFDVYCTYPAHATDKLDVKIRSKYSDTNAIRFTPQEVEYTIEQE